VSDSQNPDTPWWESIKRAERSVRSVVGKSQDTDDIVQDILLERLLKQPTEEIRDKAAFEHTVAKRRTIDALRRRSRRAHEVNIDDPAVEQWTAAELGLAALLSSDSRFAVHQALRCLDTTVRDRVWHWLDYKENLIDRKMLAEVFQVPEPKLKRPLQDFVDQVRSAVFAAYLLSASKVECAQATSLSENEQASPEFGKRIRTHLKKCGTCAGVIKQEGFTTRITYGIFGLPAMDHLGRELGWFTRVTHASVFGAAAGFVYVAANLPPQRVDQPVSDVDRTPHTISAEPVPGTPPPISSSRPSETSPRTTESKRNGPPLSPGSPAPPSSVRPPVTTTTQAPRKDEPLKISGDVQPRRIWAGCDEEFPDRAHVRVRIIEGAAVHVQMILRYDGKEKSVPMTRESETVWSGVVGPFPHKGIVGVAAVAIGPDEWPQGADLGEVRVLPCVR
jgi:hypothetical protein